MLVRTVRVEKCFWNFRRFRKCFEKNNQFLFQIKLDDFGSLAFIQTIHSRVACNVLAKTAKHAVAHPDKNHATDQTHELY